MKDEMYYVKNAPMHEVPEEGERPAPWRDTHVVGTERPRVDAFERLTGAAVYPSDVVRPNMLYAAIVRCPHAHAKVRSVDTSAAEKMKGVHAVVTGKTREAQLNWPYAKDYERPLFDPEPKFEGEAIAAVAAETPDRAWDAVRAIKVDYEVLPAVSDERKALESDAPKVHKDGNKIKTQNYGRGDVEAGFSEADEVMEENYRTACELHTPIELHGCVAEWDGNRLTLWESTQGVYAVQETVAQVMNMPRSRVRVIGHYVGGGFGSKLDTGKYSIIAAILARKTGRPVKAFLTREETYLTMGNRPPANMRLKAGVKKDGTITALDYEVTGTGGAFPSGGTSLVDFLIKELYTCENVRCAVTDVFVNAGLARPFRAPGYPQAAWALEQMMDALAEKIGMDPVEFRLKNIPDYSQAREGNPKYTTNGYPDCLKKGAEAFDWEAAKKSVAEQDAGARVRRGVGMAGCSWFIGGGWPPSTVIIRLFEDGSVNLNMGASDIGTGTKTIMAMVAAEELGVNPDAIQIENADTGTTQYASPSGGSKTVPTEAPTVRAAAIDVKRQLLEMAAKDLGTDPDDLAVRGDSVVSRRDGGMSMKITEVSGLKNNRVIVGVGTRGPNPENKIIIPFAAQFCEVEVDTLTGEINILRFVAANESGRVMNRKTYDGQVIGGVAMGIGLATTEMRVLDDGQTGKLCNRNWHDYKLPTSLDVPADIVSVPIDMPDEEANTTGAKGLGEPVTVPTAAAVANAIYNAVGIRVTESPVNPFRLAGLLADRDSKKEA